MHVMIVREEDVVRIVRCWLQTVEQAAADLGAIKITPDVRRDTLFHLGQSIHFGISNRNLLHNVIQPFLDHFGTVFQNPQSLVRVETRFAEPDQLSLHFLGAAPDQYMTIELAEVRSRRSDKLSIEAAAYHGNGITLL